ncbi:transposase [Saccharothrix sp. ALI-22-I]|uniref:RNA-guided endonuclease InsQ/TnpB family protein n=1 Tax=Saccharothrix sp. ALI-22-I TaxID=1933778 RepID=UPI00097BCF01|nr:transposase [Saccharothrix sp. ALI-22-I]
MSRYRLAPTLEQEALLLEHCAHARFVWNLTVQQHSYWRPGRASAPDYHEPRQLTEARGEFAWLRAGSHTVQQQALRDFHQAVRHFLNGTHRRPTWRKAGRDEGFRQVAVQQGHIQRLNRRHGRVWVPKVGWVRFRWCREVPHGVKSYRVTRDRARRWHIAFATTPEPIPAPGNGATVGVDRGVVVSAALSTGDLLRCPGLTKHEQQRLVSLQRRLSRCRPGSRRRERVRIALARLNARLVDRRKDWVEKTSTTLAREFDVIRIEDLRVRSMTRSAKGTVHEPGRRVRQKASLNRRILANAWSLLVTRLREKAPGRVQKVNAAYTSQQCSSRGHLAPESRKSQAGFRCVACGYSCNADVNAARNIAAGRAVTARGGGAVAPPVNREPQPAAPPPSAGSELESHVARL